MKQSTLVTLARALVLLAWVTLAAPAFAEDGPGVAAVRRANESVAALLKQKPEPGSDAEKRLVAQLSTQLGSFLDVEGLGQRALSEHWKELNAGQRKQFLTLLRELVEGNYLKAMRSNLSYEVRYLKEEEKDGSRWVSTEIHLERNGRPETMSVDYALRKEGDSWRAFDLVTDGVGLVENYRAQFNKIIAKEGFNGLIERMRKKKAQGGS
ncbi:MAG TPA: ABC transporter substrate-binding protein [Polyangiaceae bacterium]|nr:ABC transporter substrate-binding protein [Polyangiaceae bacterium]